MQYIKYIFVDTFKFLLKYNQPNNLKYVYFYTTAIAYFLTKIECK